MPFGPLSLTHIWVWHRTITPRDHYLHYWCLFSIGRTRRRGYLDHAFMHHCTIYPTWAEWRAVMHRWTLMQHQMHFCATLLILVLEIRFNFQIDVQCAEKEAISKNHFQYPMKSEANLAFVDYNRHEIKFILSSWHTWVSKGNIKGFENNGVWVAW